MGHASAIAMGISKFKLNRQVAKKQTFTEKEEVVAISMNIFFSGVLFGW